MKFDCDRCGTRYNIADEKVRRKVLKIRCRVCENIITVRGADLADQAPPPGEAEWYAAPGGQELGPMPLVRLEGLVEQGEVTGETLVWREGFDDWRPVTEVAALAKFLPARSALDDEATNTFQMHDRIDDSLREMLLGTPPPAEVPPPMFGDTVATEGIGWPEDDERPTVAEPVRRPTGPTRPVEPRPTHSAPPPSRPPLGRAMDPATQPPIEEPRRFPVVPVAAGVMLLLLLAVGIGYWVARPDPPPMAPTPEGTTPTPQAPAPEVPPAAPAPEAPPAAPAPAAPAPAAPAPEAPPVAPPTEAAPTPTPLPGVGAQPAEPSPAPAPAPAPDPPPEPPPEPALDPAPAPAPPVEAAPDPAPQPARSTRRARTPDRKVRLDVQPADADPPETLTKAQVTLVIGANWDGVTACYDQQLEAGEGLPGGKVVLRFDIRPTGRTSNARIDRVPARFADCVRGVVQGWRFPQFTGEAIPVEYPLILKPPK